MDDRLDPARTPKYDRSYQLVEGLFWSIGLPEPSDDPKITAMFAASAEDDRLGVPMRRDGDRLDYAYPVAIVAAQWN